MSTSLPLRSDHLIVLPTGRKRHRFESDDDPSATDTEGSSDSEEGPKADIDGDWCRVSQTLPPKNTQELSRRLADQIFPLLHRWMDTARYTRPPDYRIKPRKRSKKSSSGTSPSILIESEDPADPSNILISGVDGYFRIACPFSVQDPSRYESCALEYDLRSISDLIKHLGKCHPHPFYCPICGQIFGSDLACNKHVRKRSCARRNFDIVKGVPCGRLQNIAEEDNRNRPEDERWRRIYALVFPTAERPLHGAGYLGEGLPLAVAMARDYWSLHGRELAMAYLSEEGSSGEVKIEGERFSTFCRQVDEQLVQRVIADARDG